MARRSKSDDNAAGIAFLALIAGIIWLVQWVWRQVTAFWDWLGWFHWVALPLVLALALLFIYRLILRAVARLERRQAARAAAERHQAAMDKQFAYTQSLDHKQFEHLIARLLRRDGWSDAYVVGGANDRGADVIATRDGEKIVVQCKHYNGRKVGSGEMQKFLGTVFHEHYADVALFVTSSVFTREARAIGEKRGVYLMEATELARWQAYGAPSYLSA